MVHEGGAEAGDRLTLVVADLQADAGWAEAVAGCDYVVHIASPTLQTVPKTDDEMVIPAQRRRTARSPRRPGRRRATRRADLLIRRDRLRARPADRLELAVVNPTGVLGPVLGSDFSSSIRVIAGLLDSSVSGAPQLTFSYVDVRDVADLHVRAMTDPAAFGERFPAASGGPISILEIADVLRARLTPRSSSPSPRSSTPGHSRKPRGGPQPRPTPMQMNRV